ncbi:fimbrial assembly protein [Cellulomonas sp. ICMP 17802]|uniref:fimbrial assembly protein n=1 Tax=Cellulomonas sp. ICMP 17802 TaxID=3239199 RepID=UPI00351AE83F
MTTLIERPRSRSGGGSALSGTLPQVNLLPPEVRAARGLRATKRWLVISLIVTVVACVGGFGLALISGASAAGELVDAQDATARLQAEEAKYAEVPQVLGALNEAERGRTLGMSTDVDWKKYIDALAAVLPANVSIDTMNVVQATPMTPAAPPADSLQGPSIGQIQYSARTSTIPDTAAWIDALNSVPGFADAWVSSTAITEDEHGIYYQVTGTVQVTDAAYTHRFDATDGEG